MKKFNKMLSVLLSLVLCLGMVSPAFAHDVTIVGDENTYQVDTVQDGVDKIADSESKTGTITMTEDETTDSTITVGDGSETVDVTLNLNGNNLTGDGEHDVISVEEDATLTINDAGPAEGDEPAEEPKNTITGNVHNDGTLTTKDDVTIQGNVKNNGRFTLEENSCVTGTVYNSTKSDYRNNSSKQDVNTETLKSGDTWHLESAKDSAGYRLVISSGKISGSTSKSWIKLQGIDPSTISEVEIEDSVGIIGDYAFRYCTALTSVTIPDSVGFIGKGAFYGCSSLKSVTIPAFACIEGNAFRGCSSLESITFLGRTTFDTSEGAGWMFYGCTPKHVIRYSNKDETVTFSYYPGEEGACFDFEALDFVGDPRVVKIDKGEGCIEITKADGSTYTVTGGHIYGADEERAISTGVIKGGGTSTDQDGNKTIYPGGAGIELDGTINPGNAKPSVTTDGDCGKVTVDPGTDNGGDSVKVEGTDEDPLQITENEDGSITVTVPEGGKVGDKEWPDGGKITIDEDGNITIEEGINNNPPSGNDDDNNPGDNNNQPSGGNNNPGDNDNQPSGGNGGGENNAPVTPAETEVIDGPDVPLAEAPADETEVIEDADVPLAEAPADGTEVIEDADVPLAELPEEPVEGPAVEVAEEPAQALEVIEDEAVPLSGVPQTGEASTALWLAAVLIAGMGLVYVNTGKRRQNAR